MNREQIQEPGMSAQNFAIKIETILGNIFKCDRLGFGGQVNSDHIRRHPYLSMTQGLAYLYAICPQKKKEIDSFVEHFSIYEKMSLDELLSFDTNEKTIDKSTFQLEKDNGFKQVEYMIEEFRKVIY